MITKQVRDEKKCNIIPENMEQRFPEFILNLLFFFFKFCKQNISEVLRTLFVT